MATPATKDKKQNKTLRSFKGVNTQADRKTIDDDEFSWLEGIMPISHGNAKTIPGPSAALATLPAGETCFYFAEGNINNVSYIFMFCVSGSAYQVSLNSYAVTTVGAAGTFSGSTTRIAQWKNERIVIIDVNNGYFDWNGTTLTTYKGALASVTVTAAGTGFTNATTTTLTPSSGSATFSITLGANLATLGSGGSGYAVGDLLTISGGTFTSPATISVTTVSSGAITGFNLNTTGIYTVTPANAASSTGGHGSGATFTLNYGIYGVTVVTPGTGYVTAPTITISGAGAGSNAALTVNLAINTTGTTVAVYSGRVWIANNRTVVFSAPNSYSDFNPADLAGSFILTDDTISSSITRLFSANGYLYIIGANGINIVSNVTVTNAVLNSQGFITTPAATIFSNTNVTASAGTEMAESVVSYNRSMMFGIDYGIYALTGTTPQKMSDALDGIFPHIDFTQPITGGLAVIFNIICLCYQVKYNDPVTGTTKQLLCIFFNQKWYFSTQVPGMKMVTSALPDPDVPSLWATDGSSLYKLFSDSNYALPQIMQTKLWDMGDPLVTKQALKFGLATTSSNSPAVFSLNIDSEVNSTTYVETASNTLTWYNNTGAVMTWKNNVNNPITWLASGYVILLSDADNVGNYLGITLTSSSPQIVYSGLFLQYEHRTPWASSPW